MRARVCGFPSVGVCVCVCACVRVGQVEEFIDNLSRPTRQKIKNIASEPLFRFISPAMRTALTAALQTELQEVSERARVSERERRKVVARVFIKSIYI